MTQQSYPDLLRPASSAQVAAALERFWTTLEALADLLPRREVLLAAALTASLRQVTLELMLALNGIEWPEGTQHLNTYLGDSQRHAIEKTLLAPTTGGESWLGQAVALVVIYRWYAPQLVEKFGLAYPQAAEDATLARLRRLPGWPDTISTA